MTTTNPFGRQGWTPDRISSLAGRTYVITGTTTGVGYEATRVLLSKGAHVVMLNRSIERAAAAAAALRSDVGQDAAITSIHLDLASFASVRAAAAEVLDTVPRIDAFIANAAVSQVAVQEFTEDGFERHLAVNYLGHFLLTRLLFDRIDESAGRIVMVGSNSYKMGLQRIQFEDMNFDRNYNPRNPYAHSKLALMMFGYELDRRARAAGHDVEVRVCHPGWSRTDLLQGDNLDRIAKRAAAILAPITAQSAERGSWPTVLCATEDDIAPETYWGPTNRMDMVGPVGPNELDDVALDRDAATRLWTVSQEMTGVAWELPVDNEEVAR